MYAIREREREGVKMALDILNAKITTTGLMNWIPNH